MTTLEQSFIDYDNMLASAIAQFNKDLQAFSDALDTVLMSKAADDGVFDRNDECFECGAEVVDNGRPARCKDC